MVIEGSGIIGPNGSGKTTLFRVIVGKESFDSGQVTLRKGLRYGLLEQIMFAMMSLHHPLRRRNMLSNF